MPSAYVSQVCRPSHGTRAASARAPRMRTGPKHSSSGRQRAPLGSAVGAPAPDAQPGSGPVAGAATWVTEGDGPGGGPPLASQAPVVAEAASASTPAPPRNQRRRHRRPPGTLGRESSTGGRGAGWPVPYRPDRLGPPLTGAPLIGEPLVGTPLTGA